MTRQQRQPVAAALHVENAHRHDGEPTWLVMEWQRIIAVRPTEAAAQAYVRAIAYPREERALA